MSFSMSRIVRSPYTPGCWMAATRVNPGNDLPQQLPAFRAQLRPREGVPGDVASLPGEAGDQPVGDRISHSPPDDGYRIGRPLGRKGGWRPPGDDHVDVETDEVIRRTTQPVMAGRPIGAARG